MKPPGISSGIRLFDFVLFYCVAGFEMFLYPLVLVCNGKEHIYGIKWNDA